MSKMKSVFLEKISEQFQKYNYILIYGAGGVAKDLLCLLEPCLRECPQVCVVVSERKGNQDSLHGYSVKEITEFRDVREDTYVIVSVMPRYEKQIEENLEREGFQAYCTASMLIEQMYKEIWELPVSEDKIVFSHGDGYGFGGNPKYIALELLKAGADIKGGHSLDLVWLAGNCSGEFPDGIRTVPYGSYEHYYELGTAKIWIDNQHKSYFTRKRDGQFYMQTWHGGGPLKKIEFDAEGIPVSYLDLCEMNSEMEDIMVSPTRFNSRL